MKIVSCQEGKGKNQKREKIKKRAAEGKYI